jgi:hypothetical protein
MFDLFLYDTKSAALAEVHTMQKPARSKGKMAAQGKMPLLRAGFRNGERMPLFRAGFRLRVP